MQETLLQGNPIELISSHGFAAVRFDRQSKQHCLIATVDLEKDALLSHFTPGIVKDAPDYLTIQINIDRHITLLPEFLQFINHSCEPNCFFDTEAMQLLSLDKINAGDELTFFYPSTEWMMAQPFYCYCGSDSCLQNIQGAAFLSCAQREKYTFTSFIYNQFSSTRR